MDFEISLEEIRIGNTGVVLLSIINIDDNIFWTSSFLDIFCKLIYC